VSSAIELSREKHATSSALPLNDTKFFKGFHDREVKDVDFKPLVPIFVGSNPAKDFGFAIQLAYGTYVVLLECPLVTEIIQ
jgi:hypothetical protein